MELNNGHKIGWTVIMMGWVAIFAVLLSSCNNGSEIPFDPTCVELVTDECVAEVIEEFCPLPVRECFTVTHEKVCVDRDTRQKCGWDWWNRECHYEEVLTPVECEGHR